MKTLVRFALLAGLGICLLVPATSVAQKKKDKVLSKAQTMLKNYVPPQPKNVPPAESPAKAWKSAYLAKHKKTTPASAGPAVPSVKQYHKKGLSEAIRKQIADGATPMSRDERRKQLEQKIQDDERNHKGSFAKPTKRGFTPAGQASRDEMKRMLNERIAADENSGKGVAAQLKKRGIQPARQLSPAEMKAEFNDRWKNDPNNRGYVPPPPTTSEVRSLIEQHRQKTPARPRSVSTVVNGLMSGIIYNDANHNGVRDSGEVGIAGVTVSVYEYASGRQLQSISDSTGYYSFIDTVGNSEYYFYTPSTPTGYVLEGFFGGWNYATLNGDTVTGLDLGYWHITPRSISGYKYSDVNHNGVRDSGEVGLAGWSIHAYEYPTGITYSTMTDSNGYYHFDSLMAYGEYEVYETNQPGWTPIQPSNGYQYPYLYFANDTGVNFANWKVPPMLITGQKFNDLNGNGVKDPGEPGIPGWTINIYRTATYTYFQVQTDVNGNYSFVDSGYACYYQIYEQNQTGWLTTYPYSSQSAYYYTYVAGDTINGEDFGNWHVPPMMIAGEKFNDLNGNGVKDPGEPGIAGWTINIYREADYQNFQAVTDSTGHYAFVDSGFACYYQVTEQNQNGWLTTYPSRSQNANYYSYFAGDTVNNYDFGNWLVPYSSIRGTVFNDLNDNGVKDDGEPGLAGWTVRQYIYGSSISPSGEGGGGGGGGAPAETLMTVTDSAGHYEFDSLTWAHTYWVYEDQQLDWINTYPSNGYWTPNVAGDTVEGIDFGNYLPPPLAIRVNTMPSNSTSPTYANAVVGTPLAVWGNVHGGLVPLHYTLDYGDGNVDSGIVTDRRFIGSQHSYAGAGPKTMSLTVVDANDSIGFSQSVVKVYAAADTQIYTNMAVEKGLLYLYLQQYPTGYWYDNSNNVASTGAALLSFEENGHKPSNSIYTDIYAEYVHLGLNYLFNGASKYSIYAQPAGNPDANGNGYGAYLVDNVYANGIGLLAIIGSYANADSAKLDTIEVGTYAGTSFYDFIVDAMDQLAFSQTDSGSDGRGGWRYGIATPNYGDADNSTTQWVTLDLEAAQNSWGIPIPQFVKTELLYWLQYSQDGSGGFGYTGPNYWDNITKTAAGIGSYSFLGYTTDSAAVQNAIGFIDSQWDITGSDVYGWAQPLSGNTYAMYGVAKGMRLINHRSGNQFIGSHDWYAEYVTHLLADPTYGQNPDGSWPKSGTSPTGSMGNALNSSLAILVLTRGVVVQPPVAVIAPISAVPPNTEFQVDGSGSFHQDPSKNIIEYLWDWSSYNGLNWNHPDASGPKPTNPGYADTGYYTITLRVKDNGNPPLYSTATRKVHVTLNHHPPVAVAIPPNRGEAYAGKVGEPIFLDGRSSYSPDYPKDSVVSWRWDLNGNGNYYDPGDATTDTVTVTFANPYQGQVGLRVYDTHGDSSSNTAYLNIVASKTDIFVQHFAVTPDSILAGDSLHLWASFKNNDTSNTGASHVLVRFYDDDPLTVGNQIGGDFYVDLPVSAIETVKTTVKTPVRFRSGTRHIYVYLDANVQVAEWNKVNNTASQDVKVTPIRPVSGFDRLCLNFATVPLGDTLILPLTISNTGNDSLWIDSMVTKDPSFSAVDGPGDTVFIGAYKVVHIRFVPTGEGTHADTLTIYSNDVVHTISLTGQGELHSSGAGQQIYSGILTVEGVYAPVYTVLGAYRTNGDLIKADLIITPPDSVGADGMNYTLRVQNGQDGIAEGDTILFKVATLACDVIASRYCDGYAIFHADASPDSGYQTINIDGVHQRNLTIQLQPGYNAVSWNVLPGDASVSSVFGGILATNKVKIVLDYAKDASGNGQFNFYIPQLGKYNPLAWTKYKKGYFVMLSRDSRPDSMTVSGLPVCPTNPIDLDSFYNFVSYLPEQPESVAHALSSLIPGNLSLALRYTNNGDGGEGFHLYPDGDFRVMSPGEGYFVKVDSADVLVYPSPLAAKYLPAKAKHGGMKISSVKSGGNLRPRHTASSDAALPRAIFTYGLHVSVDGKTVPAGTEIKAIDKDGVVCGNAKFLADGVFAMAIYGDDPATAKDEGASPGEMVSVYIGNKLVSERVKWTQFGDVPLLEGNLNVMSVAPGTGIPKEYALHQNYPNPFNPTTSLSYDLPASSNVTLKVYDLLGAEVRTLVAESQGPGFYQVVWDGRNNAGLSVASGIYTYRLTANGGAKSFIQTRKMILMK